MTQKSEMSSNMKSNKLTQNKLYKVHIYRECRNKTVNRTQKYKETKQTHREEN